MTGNRPRRLLREEMDERFYHLGQFLGCYLHRDWPEMYGTPEGAIDTAIADYPVDLLRQTRRELSVVVEESTNDVRLRSVLNDGLGVCVYFRKPAEAREFAEMVERKLMAAIKERFEGSRVKG